MNDNQSESRCASSEAFQESLDVLGDLLDPSDEDEELSIPNQPDSQPDGLWDEVGDDLEALLHSEDHEDSKPKNRQKMRPTS